MFGAFEDNGSLNKTLVASRIVNVSDYEPKIFLSLSYPSTMSTTKGKKGKRNAPKVQSYSDKYAVTGTFTSLSSAGGSPSKARVRNVDLGYEQPLKKPKFDNLPASTEPSGLDDQTESSGKDSRSQVSFQLNGRELTENTFWTNRQLQCS